MVVIGPAGPVVSTRCFDVGKRGPDEMLDTGILGSTHSRRCLVEFPGTFVAGIGDHKDAISALECGCECLRCV